LREVPEAQLERFLEGLGAGPRLRDDGGDEALLLLDEREERVFGVELGVAAAAGKVERCTESLVRLGGHPVDSHGHWKLIPCRNCSRA
jgi:hypothetical protein